MKRPYKIAHETSTASSRELADWLATDGQLLVPLVELLEKGDRAIDEVIDGTGLATVEAVLQMSAEQVAGPKAQGRRDPDREVYWACDVGAACTSRLDRSTVHEPGTVMECFFPANQAEQSIWTMRSPGNRSTSRKPLPQRQLRVNRSSELRIGPNSA